MKPPRFLLHGIWGVYNYGCEAIVRGTVQILRTHYPDCQIVYLSRRPAEDKNALDDCPIEVWDNSTASRMSVCQVLRGLLRRARLPYSWILTERYRGYRPDDWVISIGGDIFTLGPGPYPQHGNIRKLRVPRFIMSKGCKFILWGASIGPFEAWPQAVPAFCRFLGDASLITAREPVTLNYLASLGIRDNVAAVADPAFLMKEVSLPGDFPFSPGNDRPVVGLNLSPASLRYVSGARDSRCGIEEQIAFANRLIREFDARIILIPHVLASHELIDDDYSYLENMHNAIAAIHPEYVRLLPAGLGARRTKGVISRCTILLAARMHCAIAGVSSGTPTLFIAYSAKAKGMARYVYGTDDRCINLQALNTPATFEAIRSMLRDRAGIKAYLISARGRFEQDALKGGRILSEEISKHSI